MAGRLTGEIISSSSRLVIADLLSKRPRTLKELSDKTGVSMPAVLKHLGKLETLGVLEKTDVVRGKLPARKLYSLRGTHVEDFSTGELFIVNLSEGKSQRFESKDPVKELNTLAVDNIVRRRQIRERARRLQRSIGELVENEERLKSVVEGLGLDDDERVILQTFYTEETQEEAERVLREVYDIPDPRRSIERVLSKARRSVKNR
jgi:predicted transcriptional regulator